MSLHLLQLFVGAETLHELAMHQAQRLEERRPPVDALPWRELRDLPRAQGFEFKSLVGDDPNYTTAFGCELVRLDVPDRSVPHIEPWIHALYFIKGNGEIRIGGETWLVREGMLAQVKAGERHALRNAGPGETLTR